MLEQAGRSSEGQESARLAREAAQKGGRGAGPSPFLPVEQGQQLGVAQSTGLHEFWPAQGLPQVLVYPMQQRGQVQGVRRLR